MKSSKPAGTVPEPPSKLTSITPETGAAPAFHFGADTPYTPAEGLVAIAARHPDHPVIGVHMGGGGAGFVEAEATCQAARAAGLAHPNIVFVLSAKRDTHIESALIAYAAAGGPFRRNIAVASDAPYGNMVWNFGGFRALFAALADGATYGDPRLAANPGLFDADTVQGFMGRNLADLVIAADRRPDGVDFGEAALDAVHLPIARYKRLDLRCHSHEISLKSLNSVSDAPL